jgi:3-methyladenine DNA glycosylase/8-oxoguanine DNA glycosylase
VLQTTITPRGPYDLRRMRRAGRWQADLPNGDQAAAWQLTDGRVVVRATSEPALERARFMLALDDDHTEIHRRFGRDPLLGPSLRGLFGFRPLRRATVAHSLLRAVCGQLVSSSQARDTEHAILGLAGTDAPTAADLARLSPAQMRSHGLATHRASALLRLLRTSDFERLRDVPTPVVIRRLTREPGFGLWSCGVVCLEGLGRYDHGKVGDLGFIKLVSALRGRWVEAEETAEFLAPYAEWQGLAYSYLMAGWALGLVPGADRDGWRLPRQQANRAA